MKPVSEKERVVQGEKIQAGISFCPELFTKIEELRGHEDRSHFIERMVQIGILLQDIVSGKIKMSDLRHIE
jgi:hypothetical protein